MNLSTIPTTLCSFPEKLTAKVPKAPPRRQNSLSWFLAYYTKILKSDVNDFRKPTLASFVVLSLKDNRKWHEPFLKNILQFLSNERGKVLKEAIKLVEDVIVQYSTFHYVCANKEFIEGLLSLKDAHNRRASVFEIWFGNPESQNCDLKDDSVFQTALNIINNLARIYESESELPFFRRAHKTMEGKVSFPVFVDIHLEPVKTKKVSPPIQPPNLNDFMKSDEPVFFELSRSLLKFFKAVNNSDPSDYLTKNKEIQSCRSNLCQHIVRLQNLLKNTNQDEISEQGKNLELECQKVFSDYSGLCRGTRVRNLEYQQETKDDRQTNELKEINLNTH